MLPRLLFLLPILTGCVSTSNGDYRRAQTRLADLVDSGGGVVTPLAAVKAGAATCKSIGKKNEWKIRIAPEDRAIRQAIRPDIYANYQVLCAPVKEGSTLHVEATGFQGRGGIERAFLIVPKITVFDDGFRPLTAEPEDIRLEFNALSSTLHLKWIAKTTTTKVFLLVEADNRDEKLDGEYLVPESVSHEVRVKPPAGIYASPYGAIDVRMREIICKKPPCDADQTPTRR